MDAIPLQRDEWARVLGLLDTALDLPVPERRPWLDELALDPPHLKQALRRLLDDRAAIETGDFLAAGAEASLLHAGTQLGPWRLLRELGQGGMASVWLAERHDGAHRRAVALKLPQRVFGSRVIAERFLREREILSTLQHPHIAQVLDAGEAQGQPWLALEYVAGRPITEHADAQGLSVQARLRLFLPVLQAVQHAHGQLVIHRDLKPANVLVSDEGSVKLLDFGVAKLLETGADSAATALTQLGGRALTPQYASPEQLAGRPLGVASDVYSLGVLLYELLTGRLPYRLQRDSPAALEEAILQAQVLRPSQAVTDARRARALRGDIDTIVMKALELEPARRYASAAELAQDIERHLQQLPIAARPAGPALRLRKLWARRRLALGAGLAVVLALTGGSGLALWQARQARAEAQRAEAVQRFLVDTLAGADPQLARGRTLSARELLDRSAASIGTEFAGQPLLQATVHATVQRLYHELGDAVAARRHADAAVAALQAAGATGDERYLDALKEQVVATLAVDAAAARPLAEQALALSVQREGQGSRHAGGLLASLAWIDQQTGQLADAMAHAERAVAAQQAARGGTPGALLQVLETASAAATTAGDLQAARRWLAQATALLPQVPGHPRTNQLTLRYNLARTDVQLGDFASADTTLRALRPEIEQHLGRAHNLAAVAASLHGQALMQLARFDAALVLQRQALADVQARPGVDALSVAQQQATLARLLLRAGRLDEALPLAQGTLERLQALAAPAWTERVRFDLGHIQVQRGELMPGLARMRQAVDATAALPGAARNINLAHDRLQLAVAWRGTDLPAAQAQAAAACTALRLSQPPERLFVRRCEAVQAWLAARAGQAPPAALAGARERLLPLLPAAHPLHAELRLAQAEAEGATSAAALLQLH